MEKSIESIKSSKKSYLEVAPDVWTMKIGIVNIYMIANPEGTTDSWVLVDAGLKGSAGRILQMAEKLFGKGTKPLSIVLTHGHFDHVGALSELLKIWDVPVYAHALELPYLTGSSSYPSADPTAGGGWMTLLSWAFPTKPIDLGTRAQALNTEVCIPGLPEWKVIHTPGHSAGHISLFRNTDKTLIVGDAFVTTQQESAISVYLQKRKISRPPRYFTTDWNRAYNSVKILAALDPQIAASGHGKPMAGKELQKGLDKLIMNFYQEAVPEKGRYVKEPAIFNENGTQYVPSLQIAPFITKTITRGVVSYIAFQVIKRIKYKNLGFLFSRLINI